jgi:predicted nucleic acid-binding protein
MNQLNNTISNLTLTELEQLIETIVKRTLTQENINRKATADNFIENMAVLSLSNKSLKKFGEIKAKLRKSGTTVADFDLLIASLAITEKLILVTNNTRHYQRIPNIQLENWVDIMSG